MDLVIRGPSRFRSPQGMKNDRFRLLHLDDTGNWGKLKARDRRLAGPAVLVLRKAVKVEDGVKMLEFHFQVVLSEGEVDGWVMLHHPDLGELIRTNHVPRRDRPFTLFSFPGCWHCQTDYGDP